MHWSEHWISGLLRVQIVSLIDDRKLIEFRLFFNRFQWKKVCLRRSGYVSEFSKCRVQLLQHAFAENVRKIIFYLFRNMCRLMCNKSHASLASCPFFQAAASILIRTNNVRIQIGKTNCLLQVWISIVSMFRSENEGKKTTATLTRTRSE